MDIKKQQTPRFGIRRYQFWIMCAVTATITMGIAYAFDCATTLLAQVIGWASMQ